MTNYLPASIMDPEDNFEALQDNSGNAMLFSIGTDGIFYATCETQATGTGWVRTNLSSIVLTEPYIGGTCTKFSVAQNNSDGTIGLAMVITVSGADQLFLCLGNSNSDLSWIAAPQWTMYSYDNSTPAPNPLQIANVFISETDSGQFIVADLIIASQVSRFYINTNTSAEKHWNVAPLNIDLNSLQYLSAIGRIANGSGVDGMYSGGQINGAAQLIYCPLYNAFGANPPTTNPLQLPGNLVPQAMCTFRNGNSDDSTDLLVTSVDAGGNGSLYYFASTNQTSNATATLLLQNPLLINTSKLVAYLNNGTLTVWGLNGADQVFYLTCNYSPDLPGTWTNPLPVLSGIDMMSPYVNVSNGGNTIFAVGDNNLFIITKSPVTSLWSTKEITLPQPLTNSKALSFSSYTTRIQLLDPNNNTVPNSPLMLSANTRATFYINNLYYVLDTTPVPVNTDSFGSITLVESISDLSGTIINVGEAGGTAISINPMNTSFTKIAQLNTSNALQSAVITSDDGSTRPLVPTGTSSNNLTAAATANQGLASAYSNINTSGIDFSALRLSMTNMPVVAGFENAIAADIGDIFNWLKSGIGYVINKIEQLAEGVWTFIVTIAGKVYQGILNCVESVVAAVEWVFREILTLIKDLIAYLEFLFGWQDILTTHNVLRNIFIQYTQYSIDGLANLGTIISNDFNTIRNTIDSWAGISGINQTPNGSSSANPLPASVHSAPANLGMHHFQGNVSASSSSYTQPSISEEIFKDLIQLINAEEQNVSNAATQIQTQIIDQFGTLSGDQIMQRFLAIAADLIIGAVEPVIVAVINILVQLSDTVLSAMTATINIPVLSWLYNELTGNELSFLDLMCLICAIPATIAYKLINNAAPFPQGSSFTNSLINATNFSQIQSLYTGSPGLTAISIADGKTGNTAEGSSSSPTPLGIAFCVAGVVALIGAQVMVVCAVKQAVPTPSKALALVNAVGNCLYVTPDIVGAFSTPGRWDVIFNDTLTGISILKGFALDINWVGQKVSSYSECILNIIWFVPVIANVVYSTGSNFYPSLVPDTIGNSAFNVGGILAPFNNNPDVLIVQCGCMEIYGGEMVISGIGKLLAGS